MIKDERSRRLRGAGWVWLWGLLAAGGAALYFGWLGSEVLEREVFAWDAPILLAVNRLHTPWLDRVMIGVSAIGLPGGVVVTLLVGGWLWYRGQHVAALALVVSFGGAWLIYTLLKLLYTRPRPTLLPLAAVLQDYSFPSGHALTALSLYGFIALLLWQQKRGGWAILVLLFALLIAFSRIYLGVHYPSDILGAFAVGVVWLAAVFMGYRFMTRPAPSKTI